MNIDNNSIFCYIKLFCTLITYVCNQRANIALNIDETAVATEGKMP
jgi:hypothetical protein